MMFSKLRPIRRGVGRFLRDPLGSIVPRSPRVDLVEGDQEIIVRAEMPGMDPGEIEVTLHGDVLVVSGEGKDKSRHGAFCYKVRLPTGGDPERTIAEVDKGVLTVTISRMERLKPRRIPVTGRKPATTEDIAGERTETKTPPIDPESPPETLRWEE